MPGSSPRVWGILNHRKHRRLSLRFIPTRVGNTPTIPRTRSSLTVHPHACGEYAQQTHHGRQIVGSSPRVWGIQAPVDGIRLRGRFIPTRVGNTPHPCRWRSYGTVHPHACGEYSLPRAVLNRMPGSSPRVWGIHRRVRVVQGVSRFIPTRVGNTMPGSSSARTWSVHPHACGEYKWVAPTARKADGSSPRVWGIHDGYEVPIAVVRFIPTRVGNTPIPLNRPETAAVHPHACGEYTVPAIPANTHTGSSPRVWGILPVTVSATFARRFIPTRVGNTPKTRQALKDGAVHPHACGEYYDSQNHWQHMVGSSPRVWGIRRNDLSAHDFCWFIPTRVGNTLQEDARNNRLLAELQRATEPCVLQACSDDDKKGKELCKAAPSPRKTLPGRAVTLS